MAEKIAVNLITQVTRETGCLCDRHTQTDQFQNM